MSDSPATRPDREAVITVRGLKNQFGPQVVHENLDLDVWKGEVLGIVGGSGTGKSVLLRTIVGLVKYQDTEEFRHQNQIRFHAFFGDGMSHHRGSKKESRYCNQRNNFFIHFVP